MEIWSSPAAYDELNGNAERGGADPIARELEEGEGGSGGPASRMGMEKGMGMRQNELPPELVWSGGGRGWSGAIRAGVSPCLLPTCAFPWSRSPSPPSGPGFPLPDPLGTPRVTPTLKRAVPPPGVAGRGALPGFACARGEMRPSCRGNGAPLPHPLHRDRRWMFTCLPAPQPPSPRASRSLQP